MKIYDPVITVILGSAWWYGLLLFKAWCELKIRLIAGEILIVEREFENLKPQVKP